VTWERRTARGGGGGVRVANMSCACTWRRSKIEQVCKVRGHMCMDGKQSLTVAQTTTEASERLHAVRK
jgi:hypothetical protein